MNEELITKKKKLEQLQLEMNVLRLETRLLEIDEEKIKIAENLEDAKQRIIELGKEE